MSRDVSRKNKQAIQHSRKYGCRIRGQEAGLYPDESQEDAEKTEQQAHSYQRVETDGKQGGNRMDPVEICRDQGRCHGCGYYRNPETVLDMEEES